mgnify:CR=1 FL=1
MSNYIFFGIIVICIISYGVYIIRKRKKREKDQNEPEMMDTGIYNED